MRHRVVYWNNIPSPYVVERFNTIADRGNLDFEAWFSARSEPDRSWAVEESTWRFPYRYLPRVDVRGRSFTFPTQILESPRPDLLISLYAAPSFLVGWSAARLRGLRTVFWVEPTRDEWVARYAWKESLKSRLFPRVDGFFTTGADGRRFITGYGGDERYVFPLPYFAAYDTFAGRAERAHGLREEIRKRYNLRGVTFVYVGRLWWGKGVAYLLDAFARMRTETGVESTLLLLGDGQEEAALRARAAELDVPVVFGGFAQRDQVPEVLTACDAFVFPTLGDPFGLVVEEAMACGLPVVSTSAAGEIRERIREGETGFVVPPRDSGALADRMSVLARNADLRRRMGEAARTSVSGLTQEYWAALFEAGVDEIVRRPRSGADRRRMGAQ